MLKKIDHDENDYFSAAIKHILDKQGRGGQKKLAIDTGIDKGYISQLKNGKRKASVKTQIIVAKSLGMDYLKLLDVGRNVVSGDDVKLSNFSVSDSSAGYATTERGANEELDLYKKLCASQEYLIIMLKKESAALTAKIKELEEMTVAVHKTLTDAE